MELCTSIEKMRDVRSTLSKNGKPVGLVPTMGALHEGHLQLIREASQEAEVVVSIFVNPTQFAPSEDLDRYPRDPEGDLEKCRNAGVKAVFMPSPEEMYPSDLHATSGHIRLSVGDLNQQMCGASRPGHFEGVCQVVTKLFHIVQPDVAWFGQKDIQQYVILETMVRELNFPVDMRMVPTVREADGLAMSSRNRYLSAEERQIAPQLAKALVEIKTAMEMMRESGTDAGMQAMLMKGIEPGKPALSSITKFYREQLTRVGFRIDYLDVYKKETLQVISDVEWRQMTDGVKVNNASIHLFRDPVVIACAAWLGSTRLIDNIVLS